ncbi:hypothetical protein INT43_001465, partial [Umbelopsis isabellina]
NPDSDAEDSDHEDVQTSFQAISLDSTEEDRIIAQKFNIQAMALPETLQADRIEMPNIAYGMYRRTLADVKFQMAKQDTLDVDQAPMIEMAENTDLIKGIYEGGFKTWECSLDLVEFMHSMDDEAFANKKILELGCGSALPGIYLLMRNDTTRVDFQDYNEQVLQYITIPNIILNTVVSPTSSDQVAAENTATNEVADDADQEDEGYDDDDEDDEDEHVPDDEPADVDTADAELEIAEGQAGSMLERICLRTQCYLGEWKTLPDAMSLSDNSDRYDMIVTSETVYSEESIPGLVNALQNTLKKPEGVAYVAGKTIYFGVGGGILPFCNAIDSAKDDAGHKLKYESVFETSGENTVKREILKITWAWDI